MSLGRLLIACRELQKGPDHKAQAAGAQAGWARGYLFAGLLGGCALIKGLLNIVYGWEQACRSHISSVQVHGAQL